MSHSAWVIVEAMRREAKQNVVGNQTGWSTEKHGVRCAYFPISRTTGYFTDKTRVTRQEAQDEIRLRLRDPEGEDRTTDT